MALKTSPAEATSKKYNFIVIGGGTAGLVMAARLSEQPDISVLVLEAGENRLDDPKIAIPALMTQLYEDPDYDWSFKTVPQEALHGRVVAQPRGKVLGGSSAMHFLMASYPSARDIDNWEKLGNPTWNWNTLLPYYQKSETFNPPADDIKTALGGDIFDPELYGKRGPTQLTLPHSTGPADAAWRPTLQALDVGAESDPRRGQTLGGYAVLKYIDKEARRSHAGTAYYLPAAERKNLVVLTGAHVNKILIDADNTDGGFKATGVSFTVAGEDYTVSALNEVILSAGSIQSPQILELSGIGDTQTLERAGVKVLIENQNVGENLQDHPLVPLIYSAVEGIPTAETIRQPGVLDWSLNEWQSGRGGPLASGVSGTAFLSHESIASDAARVREVSQLASQTSIKDRKQLDLQHEIVSDAAEADIQLTFAPAGMNPYSSDRVSGLFAHTDPGNYIGSVAVLNHPFSRGSSHIISSDPQTHPVFNPNYFAKEVDFEIMVDAILFLQRVYNTAPMADLVKSSEDGNSKEIQPNFKIQGPIDRSVAEKLVRDAAISSWHPIGTCAMLPRDAGGVVDPQLKVYGAKGLRVVDASIMPLHVRGNIASSVYALAERAADMIKQDFVAMNH